jgi:hypothetical protein
MHMHVHVLSSISLDLIRALGPQYFVMKDDRLRQPIKSDYMDALGTAAFCFAICEWNAVYCAERIRPGSLNAFVRDELTAGKIAKKLLGLARNMPKSPERVEVIAVAQSFSDLVPLRNSILHGKPCTGPSGEARLSTVKIFEIPDLEDAADAFSTCSIELNRLLHGFLATYKPS